MAVQIGQVAQRRRTLSTTELGVVEIPWSYDTNSWLAECRSRNGKILSVWHRDINDHVFPNPPTTLRAGDRFAVDDCCLVMDEDSEDEKEEPEEALYLGDYLQAFGSSEGIFLCAHGLALVLDQLSQSTTLKALKDGGYLSPAPDGQLPVVNGTVVIPCLFHHTNNRCGRFSLQLCSSQYSLNGHHILRFRKL